MRQLILAVSLIIAGSCAHASDREVVVYGLGNDSCGKFLSALSKAPPEKGLAYKDIDYMPDSALYLEWLSAYVTAFNLFNDQHKNITTIDRQGLIFWAKNYCEKQPLDTIADAAWKLIQEQGKFDMSKYDHSDGR